MESLCQHSVSYWRISIFQFDTAIKAQLNQWIRNSLYLHFRLNHNEFGAQHKVARDSNELYCYWYQTKCTKTESGNAKQCAVRVKHVDCFISWIEWRHLWQRSNSGDTLFHEISSTIVYGTEMSDIVMFGNFRLNQIKSIIESQTMYTREI